MQDSNIIFFYITIFLVGIYLIMQLIKKSICVFDTGNALLLCRLKYFKKCLTLLEIYNLFASDIYRKSMGKRLVIFTVI